MAEANGQPVESNPGTRVRGTVENKASKPAGLLPKNMQQLVILGVAVVMVLIMWLTGGSKRASGPAPGTPLARIVQPPDPATVQEFKQTIQKEQAASRQPISSSDLARLQSLGLAGDIQPGTAVVPPDGTVPQPGAAAGGEAGGPQQLPPADPLKEDKRKREYLSLFAPNVAFTYRKGPEAEHLIGQETRESTLAALRYQSLRAPTTEALDPATRETQAQLLAEDHSAAQNPVASPNALSEKQSTRRQNPDGSVPGAFNSFSGKRFVVFEGTVLEALLINRLNGTFSGPVNCLLTNDIYSHDGQHVLIPAGTKILGEAKKVEAFGQQRLAVFFHRLIMPDGYSINLDEFKGLNQIGETALRDKVNNHYLQIFGASLAIGVLGGIAQAGTGNATTNSTYDQARAGFGASLAVSAAHILDKFLNILPTVTIGEGSRVKVYLAGDLLLPDYAQHTVEPNI
jgi:type IV secretion system protein VirB10